MRSIAAFRQQSQQYALASFLFLFFLLAMECCFIGAVLFLSLLCTDWLDGYLARRFGLSTKFGIYFDVTTDFIFVFCMFLTFNLKGFVPEWVLVLIIFVFAQFVITSIYSDKIYDPVGKYYGSLLYGAIGLRFICRGNSSMMLLRSESRDLLRQRF